MQASLLLVASLAIFHSPTATPQVGGANAQPFADETGAKALRAAYQIYRDAGQTSEARVQMLAAMKRLDEKYGSDVDYLLEKWQVLGWLDDRTAAQAAFALVADRDLTRPMHIGNRLGRRIDKGEWDLAVPLAQRLAQLDPASWVDRVHNSLAQRSSADKARLGTTGDLEAVRDFLGRFEEADSQAAAHIARPLVLWLDALEAGDDTEVLSAVAGAMAEEQRPLIHRYRLMICELMKGYGKLNAQALDLLELTLFELEEVVAQIEERTQNGKRATRSGALSGRERSKQRFLLARALHLRGQFEEDPGSWYAQAAAASPDKVDMEYSVGFFYERAVMATAAEFRSPYGRWLESVGRPEEALLSWVEQARINPESIEALRAAYGRIRADEGFDAFWQVELRRELHSAPAFTLKTPGGKSVSSADYQGKWLLLDFWGTWCAPCRRELPALQALVDELRKRGAKDAAVLTVACNDQPESVTKFMASKAYTYDVVMGEEDVINAFEVRGYPTKILITPDGKWFKLEYGTKDWRSVVDRYLLGTK